MRRAARISKEKRLAEAFADGAVLVAAATRATYLGSIEHKTYRSPAGDPRPRGDASKCPRLEERRWPELTEALRAAIRIGCVSETFDPDGFPRYVWGMFEGELYEARHLVTPAGAYKAFPIEPFELPSGARERMEGGAGS
jgi:hypothetical protein